MSLKDGNVTEQDIIKYLSKVAVERIGTTVGLNAINLLARYAVEEERYNSEPEQVETALISAEGDILDESGVVKMLAELVKNKNNHISSAAKKTLLDLVINEEEGSHYECIF